MTDYKRNVFNNFGRNMGKRQIFFSNEYVHKFFKSIENYTIKCRIIQYLIKN